MPALLLAASVSYADITPEKSGVETLGQPTDTWFVNRSANGAYLFDKKTEKISINYDTIYEVLTNLANELLMIQARGDYEAAKKMIEMYAKETEIIKQIREKLSAIPIDIRPVYAIDAK